MESTSITPNCILLVSDRENQSMSQESLEYIIKESGASVNISTIRRAERGQNIRMDSLVSIARGLGYDAERYILDESLLENVSNADVSGDWLGYFIELDISKNITENSLVTSTMQISQHGCNLQINAITETPDGDNREMRFVDATLLRDMLAFRSFYPAWRQPSGVASSQLKLGKGGDWLDGFSIWYDLDTEQIECSREIHVRKDAPYFDAYCEEANRLMLQEKELYADRIKLRAD